MNGNGKAQAGPGTGAVIGVLGTLALLAGLAAAGPLTVEWDGAGAGGEDAPPTGGGSAEPTASSAVEPSPPPADGDGLDSFVDTYAEVSGGVVRIVSETCADSGATGSGALVSPELVLTAAHVVVDHSSIQLQLGEQTVTGEVVGYSAPEDLALVRASSPLEGHVFELLPEPAGIGTPVVALGYPRSGPLSMAGPGIVSAYGDDIGYEIGDEVVDVDDVMRITTPTNPGNSGGPVIDVGGRIAGVVSGGARHFVETGDDGTVEVDVVLGFEYAIPVDTARPRVEEWMSEPVPVEPQSCDDPPEQGQPTELVTTTADGPEIDIAAQVLFDYFDGVNRSDYERAYRQFSAARQTGESLDSFTDGQISSVVSDVVILNAWREDDELRAVVTFRSRQTPELGPAGLGCAYWTLGYTLVPGGEHGWAIHHAAGLDEERPYEEC